MTNREWLLNKMQNMSDEEFVVELQVLDSYCPHYSNNMNRIRCKDNCVSCVAEWLKTEHKEPIILSEVERIILENIDKEYKWIARDKNGTLAVYAKKPDKHIGFDMWNSDKDSNNIPVFNHLFQFITWEDEEPYSIEELLKGE